MNWGGVHDSGQILNTSSLIYTRHFHSKGNPPVHTPPWFTVSIVDQEVPFLASL